MTMLSSRHFQAFKNRFSIITYLVVISSCGIALSDIQETNDCSPYFQQLVNKNDDAAADKWSGLIEFGVSRKQMWGFDITAVFLFDDKTFKVHGRPIINFELQKSHYHVLQDILEGSKVGINVTFPHKFEKSILKLVSVELDYQVICEDKNVRMGELFSFNFKFKASSELIKKVSDEIEYEEKGLRSSKCGIPHNDTHDENIDIVKLDEDRLDSKIWPWIASLYVDEKFRCTVNMVTRSEGVTTANCLDPNLNSAMRLEAYNNRNYRVRNFTTYESSLALIFLEDPITDPDFVPACLASKEISFDTSGHFHGSVIGFEKKFHEDYVVLNRVNITTMSIKDCINVKNGTISTAFHTSHFCGISKNGLTWLELDGLDGFYSLENSHQWTLDGVIHECLSVNDTDNCDFDSPIIIMDVPNDWLLNMTMYHPLGLERHQRREIERNADSTKSLTILLILAITMLGIVAMWALWYVCRRRSRPLISEVPSILSTNDGIQLLKRENKRFSYLN